jgi:hypothetical protein
MAVTAFDGIQFSRAGSDGAPALHYGMGICVHQKVDPCLTQMVRSRSTAAGEAVCCCSEPREPSAGPRRARSSNVDTT